MDYALAGLPVQIIKQGGLYIAYSHKLDISTTGKSEKQAVDRFGNLIEIFLTEIVKKNGSFDNRLLELGWTQRQKRWYPPLSKADIAAKLKATVSRPKAPSSQTSSL